jgi:hypothetical protein
MDVTRAGFLKGLLAAAAVPAVAEAAHAKPADGGAFRPDTVTDGPHPWTAAPPATPGPLRFVVVGDNTGLARPGVFAQAMKQVGWLEPDFVLSVGDLIEGYADDKAELDRQWDAIEHAIAGAGCPFLFTPGNHDMNSPASVAAWQERRGPAYYAFTYKRALFLVLSTEDPPTPMPPEMVKQFYQIVGQMQADPDKVEAFMRKRLEGAGNVHGGGEYGKDLDVANISDAQLAFVENTLKRHADIDWTFVTLHKPAWKMATPAFAKVQKMLGTRPYTVFAGHTHYFTHDTLDGHDFINMATAGGIVHELGSGTMDHAMLVTLTPNGPVYANTKLTGLMDVAGATGQIRAY